MAAASRDGLSQRRRDFIRHHGELGGTIVCRQKAVMPPQNPQSWAHPRRFKTGDQFSDLRGFQSRLLPAEPRPWQQPSDHEQETSGKNTVRFSQFTRNISRGAARTARGAQSLRDRAERRRRTHGRRSGREGRFRDTFCRGTLEQGSKPSNAHMGHCHELATAGVPCLRLYAAPSPRPPKRDIAGKRRGSRNNQIILGGTDPENPLTFASENPW